MLTDKDLNFKDLNIKLMEILERDSIFFNRLYTKQKVNSKWYIVNDISLRYLNKNFDLFNNKTYISIIIEK